MTEAPEPDLVTRDLTAADAEASRRLGWEAFGFPSPLPAEPAELVRLGAHVIGVFAGATLAGRVVDREFDSWFGGVPLPTAGIAGVTTGAEFRGRGLLGSLFGRLLPQARARGAVISTLFPTAPRIYRRFGYEVVGDFTTVEVPTRALAAAPVVDDVRTRRAEVADVPALLDVYEEWAAQHNGPLTRRGPSFDRSAEDWLGGAVGVTGVTVAEVDGRVRGFTSWRRGVMDGPGHLEVDDLFAADPEALRALVGVLGSFSSVTPVARIESSGYDAFRVLVPTVETRVVRSRPYMLRLLDPAAAISARRYPPIRADVQVGLAGDVLPGNDGRYAVEVGDGAARCTRLSEEPGAGPVLTPRGLAMLFAGAHSTATVRLAGQLSGPRDDDATLDVLFAGREVHIRDYF